MPLRMDKKARAAAVKAAASHAPSPVEPRPEIQDDEVPDVDPAPDDGDRALEAITAVAKLRISGTAAAKNSSGPS